MKMRHICATLLLVALTSTKAFSSHPCVKLGIDVLAEQNFSVLKGKRVGLVSNPAGVNSKGISTLDILRNSKNVNLVALYGPEHGAFGKVKAEIKVGNAVDERTGLPVYSLYGEYRKPSAEMLKGIDVMVVDLQDVGVRCYTYISCMRYVMEGCFENGIDVVVLDRPNPLSGLKVDGPPMDYRWLSYVGAYQVPFVHGLTIGELALIAYDQMGWLRDKAKLAVVPMEGWKRNMTWDKTGLTWVPTSPYIPTFESVIAYPMTGLGGEGSGFSNGVAATQTPFRAITYKGKTSQEIADYFNKKKIKGLSFKVVDTVNPKTGKKEKAVMPNVTNYQAWRPAELAFHLMQTGALWADKNPYAAFDSNKMILYNKHVGSDEWWNAISKKGKDVDVMHFVLKWEKQAKVFQEWSKQYWLYE